MEKVLLRCRATIYIKDSPLSALSNRRHENCLSDLVSTQTDSSGLSRVIYPVPAALPERHLLAGHGEVEGLVLRTAQLGTGAAVWRGAAHPRTGRRLVRDAGLEVRSGQAPLTRGLAAVWERDTGNKSGQLKDQTDDRAGRA